MRLFRGHLYIGLFRRNWKESELSVTMVVRQKGDRRFNLPVEFPLVDSQGLFVIKDRRQLSERRKVKDDTDDLMVMLSEMADDLSI